jgi:Holliday junction resolvase-like predicted endonuclease
LRRRGGRIVGRNRRIGPDEVDLLVRIGARLVAVEVKSRLGSDPVWEFTAAKAERLRRAAGALQAARCDLIAVRFDGEGVGIRWMQGVC